eukprot:Blabericola_migrator_1__4203@NODE_228_length_11100_cov_168_633645_g194_i0_p7_GENE_NODE_228_length_11100_cov_168_633645_g194_i0NODE_228_length_11100_cov_168_633645_g194_i0_p7_ORF_typecomplete_len175_score33_11DUF1077/PF06417_12/1_4e27_NODE_228_length_11100_cov_168_633645_g194_i029633487
MPPKSSKYSGLLSVLDDPDVVNMRKNESDRLLTELEQTSVADWEQNIHQRAALVQKRAWELSISPVKAQFMNVFMMYMMGNGGIFTIIILGYTVLTSVRTVLGITKAFENLQQGVPVPVNLTVQKSIYLVTSLMMLGYFLYQCSKSGLLPVTEVHVGTLPSIVTHKIDNVIYKI